MVLTQEDVPFASLPGVKLKGLDVYRCPSCGNFEVAIPNLPGLCAALTEHLVEKPGRLTPAESRFLRKGFGHSEHSQV